MVAGARAVTSKSYSEAHAGLRYRSFGNNLLNRFAKTPQSQAAITESVTFERVLASKLASTILSRFAPYHHACSSWQTIYSLFRACGVYMTLIIVKTTYRKEGNINCVLCLDGEKLISPSGRLQLSAVAEKFSQCSITGVLPASRSTDYTNTRGHDAHSDRDG